MTAKIDEPDTISILREPIHQQILPHIRKDIVEIRWKPGTRLPEPLLCREFGISRTPLRMALRVLETEGLVKIVPNVGAVVTKPSRADIVETMQTISAIEEWAIHCVTERQEPAVIDEITRLYDQMRAAAATGDSATYYRINDDFHRAIVVGCGNRRLADMHKTMTRYIDRERHNVNESEPFPSSAAENHAKVIDNLIAGDAKAAAVAMHEHIDFVTGVLVAHLNDEDKPGHS